MLLIVKEILFVSTIGNVKRTVWRKCILMLGCKGLNSKTKDNYLLDLFQGYRLWPTKCDPSASQQVCLYETLERTPQPYSSHLNGKAFLLIVSKKKIERGFVSQTGVLPKTKHTNTFTNKSKSWELQNKPLICFLLKCKCFDCWSKRWCGHNVIFQLNRKRQLNFLTLRW